MNALLRPGSPRCQCSVCGRFFSTDRNFRRHRAGPIHQRRCVDPASIGLIADARGIWHTPYAGSGQPHSSTGVARDRLERAAVAEDA